MKTQQEVAEENRQNRAQLAAHHVGGGAAAHHAGIGAAAHHPGAGPVVHHAMGIAPIGNVAIQQAPTLQNPVIHEEDDEVSRIEEKAIDIPSFATEEDAFEELKGSGAIPASEIKDTTTTYGILTAPTQQRTAIIPDNKQLPIPGLIEPPSSNALPSSVPAPLAYTIGPLATPNNPIDFAKKPPIGAPTFAVTDGDDRVSQSLSGGLSLSGGTRR